MYCHNCLFMWVTITCRQPEHYYTWDSSYRTTGEKKTIVKPFLASMLRRPFLPSAPPHGHNTHLFLSYVSYG